MFIIPENIDFDDEVSIKDCERKLISAKEKISSRLIDGLRDFEYSPDSKEYRKYKDKVGMSKFLYGLALVFFLIDIAGGNNLTLIIILGVVVNTGYLLYNYSEYRSLKKWYDDTKPKVVRMYYNEWQRIYGMYCEWCREHKQKPLSPSQIPIVYNDVEVEYRKYY